MNGLIDAADRVYWWLKQRPPVAAGIGVVIVGAIVLLLVAGGGDDKPKVPASAVATVGDRPISNASLNHWVTVYTSANTGSTKPTVAQARKAAFELLAGATWIESEAARQDISVSATEAKKATDDYLRQAATSTKLSQAEVLKQLGTNAADLEFQQRTALLASRLQEKIVKALPAPTTAQIAKAYNDDPQLWATPSQRNADVLITATAADAAAAFKALESGQSFTQVSQKYSASGTASANGGALENLRPGSTDPVIERPIFKAPLNRLSAPVKVGTGYMIFRVTKITPLPRQTLQQAQTAIKANLTAVAQNTATTNFLTDLRKRWRPQTTCRSTITSTEYCGKKA